MSGICRRMASFPNTLITFSSIVVFLRFQMTQVLLNRGCPFISHNVESQSFILVSSSVFLLPSTFGFAIFLSAQIFLFVFLLLLLLPLFLLFSNQLFLFFAVKIIQNFICMSIVNQVGCYAKFIQFFGKLLQVNYSGSFL